MRGTDPTGYSAVLSVVGCEKEFITGFELVRGDLGEDLRKWGSALWGSRVNSIIGHLNQSDLEGGKGRPQQKR